MCRGCQHLRTIRMRPSRWRRRAAISFLLCLHVLVLSYMRPLAAVMLHMLMAIVPMHAGAKKTCPLRRGRSRQWEFRSLAAPVRSCLSFRHPTWDATLVPCNAGKGRAGGCGVRRCARNLKWRSSSGKWQMHSHASRAVAPVAVSLAAGSCS